MLLTVDHIPDNFYQVGLLNIRKQYPYSELTTFSQQHEPQRAEVYAGLRTELEMWWYTGGTSWDWYAATSFLTDTIPVCRRSNVECMWMRSHGEAVQNLTHSGDENYTEAFNLQLSLIDYYLCRLQSLSGVAGFRSHGIEQDAMTDSSVSLACWSRSREFKSQTVRGDTISPAPL